MWQCSTIMPNNKLVFVVENRNVQYQSGSYLFYTWGLLHVNHGKTKMVISFQWVYDTFKDTKFKVQEYVIHLPENICISL